MTGLTPEKEFSRRNIIKGGGALVVGLSFAGLASAPGAGAAAAAAAPRIDNRGYGLDPSQIDSWLIVHPDNSVTVTSSQSAVTSQSTGIVAIVAEELNLGVDQVHMSPRDTWSVVDEGMMASNSNWAKETRAASAYANQALLGLAATQLGVPVGSLSSSKGVISGGGKSVTFGQLMGDKLFNVAMPTNTNVTRGDKTWGEATLDVGVSPAKPVAQYSIVGTSVPRIDLPDKITGTYTYVQNLRIPGMLHGRVVRPQGQTLYGAHATVVSVDESSVSHIPGAKVVHIGDFLGVVAPREFDAIQGAGVLKVVWKLPQDSPLPGSGNLYASMRTAPPGTSSLTGNVDAALAGAAKTVSGTYAWPFHMHGTLGPPAAIVSVTPSLTTIYTCSQDTFAAVRMTAKLLGIPQSQVRAFNYEGAGFYGENVSTDPVVAAALMSRAVGAPVRVQWMRYDDHGWDNYGETRLQDLRAGIDATGHIVAWDVRAWGNTWPTGSISHTEDPGAYTSAELAGVKTTAASNPIALAAGKLSKYFAPNQRLVNSSLTYFRSAWMRGPGEWEANWAYEQMIDDLAHAANMDPIAFRKLNFDTSVTSQRWSRLLDIVTQELKWTPAPPAANVGKGDVVKGRGLALATFGGTLVVNVAFVNVNKKTGKIGVDTLCVFGDCGFTVNPDSVANQFTGSAIQFLSRAMSEEVRFSRKNVTSLDWVTYPILRFKDSPLRTVVRVVPQLDQPSGHVGEVGGEAVAPAVANAFFDATGIRIRRVPMTPARVRAVLKAGADGPAGFGG
jgi:CO/xanthine dehydrogenase Mo-binding subunit